MLAFDHPTFSYNPLTVGANPFAANCNDHPTTAATVSWTLRFTCSVPRLSWGKMQIGNLLSQICASLNKDDIDHTMYSELVKNSAPSVWRTNGRRPYFENSWV